MRTFFLTEGPVWRRRILIGLVIGVPVFFLRTGEDPFNVPKLALLMAGTAVVGGIRLIEILQGAGIRGLSRLSIPAAAIAGPLTIAWLFSPYKSYALFGLFGRFQGLVPYLVVVLFGLLLADAFADRPMDLAWATVIAGGFVGGYAVVQKIGADPFMWASSEARTSDAISSIGNTNFVGGFLAITIPVGVGMWFVDEARRGKVIVLTALMVAGCYLAESQGGWAAAVAGSSVVLGLMASRRWRPAALLGALAAVASAAVSVAAVLYTIVTDRFGPFEYTVASRGWWWEAAVGMFRTSPIFGRGPNSFYVEAAHFRPLDDAIYWSFSIADDPHSVLFAFLTSAGVLGALGFLSVLGFALWKARELDPGNLIGVAFLGGVVAYFTQAMISIDEVTLRVALWVVLAGLVIAVESPPGAQARASKEPPPRKKKRAPAAQPLRNKPLVALVGVTVVAAVLWSVAFVWADDRAHRALRAISEEGIDEGKQLYDLALAVRDDYEYRRRFALRLAAVSEGGADEAYLRARELLSYLDGFPHVNAIVEEGRLVWDQVDGQPDLVDDGLSIYERAFAIDPLNPIIRVEYAEVLAGNGDDAFALEIMEEFADQVPTDQYPSFWGMLALVRAEDGDEDAAAAAIRIALKLDPKDSRALQAQGVIDER